MKIIITIDNRNVTDDFEDRLKRFVKGKYVPSGRWVTKIEKKPHQQPNLSIYNVWIRAKEHRVFGYDDIYRMLTDISTEFKVCFLDVEL